MRSASSELLASALETIDEAIGIYDAEDRLAACNRHYAEVRTAIGGDVTLGVRWDDLITASVRARAIPEAIGQEEEWLEQRRRSRGAYSIIRQVPDGRWYQVNERRMPNGGIAVVWTEISKLVATERHLAAERDRVLEQLLHVSRLSTAGQMASMLIHEMNQPLTAITNYMSALRRFLENPIADPEKVRDIIQRAADQAGRASELAQRFRAFLTRGKIAFRETDLNKLVGEALDLLAWGGKTRDINVEASLMEDIPPIMADRVLLQQVAVNLIRNAAEAMQQSDRKAICVSTVAHPDRAAVELRVADTGPGIAPEVAEHLFEPFTTTRTDGMGLGLSICQDIVTEHGGEFTFSANIPVGAVFSVVLPVAMVRRGPNGGRRQRTPGIPTRPILGQPD